MKKVFLLCVCAAVMFAIDAAAQCPTIAVKGPAGITSPGEDITFSAEVNVVGPKLTYVWSVNNGTITGGQGTREITITTFGLSGEAVTATVEVGGVPSECDKRASESAGIDQRIVCGLAYDEWGEKVSLNDQRGRLDSFFSSLANLPANIGFIVFKVRPGDRMDPRNSRIKFALKHIKFRRADKSRIWFFLEQSEERSTRLHIVPPGTEHPCEGCLLLKGEHL